MPCARGFVVESLKKKSGFTRRDTALRFENQVKFRGGGTAVGLHAGDCVFVLPNEERQFSESAGGNALLYLVILENYQKQVQSQFFN